MARKKKQQHHYVLVMTGKGPVFVTSMDIDSKVAHWEMEEKPLELTPEDADYMVLGLTWNGNTSFHVVSDWEITNHAYNYPVGEFKWVKKETED